MKYQHNITKVGKRHSMKTVKAYSRDFFQSNLYPITVRAIAGDTASQHELDLTDIRHSHDFAELIIITEGYGIHWIDEDKYPVTAGDVFLIQGDTEHYFMERHGLSFFNVMFDAVRLEKYLKNLRSLPGYNALFLLEPSYRRRHHFKSRLHVSASILSPVETVIHEMVGEIKKSLPGHDSLLLAKLIEIIVFFSREYSKVNIPQARSLYRLGKVISELEKSYKRNWKLSEIAKITSMAESTLLPIFKEATGYSPIEYLIQVRLRKARELLTRTTLNISDIAMETGFSDSNYFTRQFRKNYGTSPREYRHMHMT